MYSKMHCRNKDSGIALNKKKRVIFDLLTHLMSSLLSCFEFFPEQKSCPPNKSNTFESVLIENIFLPVFLIHTSGKQACFPSWGLTTVPINTAF